MTGSTCLPPDALPDLRRLGRWLETHGRRHPVTAIATAETGVTLDEQLADRLQTLWSQTEGPHGSPDPVECLLLYLLASACGGKVLELGCWQGRSTCFLAQGSRRVTSVDWFQGDMTGGWGADRDLAERALARHGLEAEIVEADMLEVPLEVAEGAGLVFYDADHRAEPAVQTLARLLPQVRPEALVVFHDADYPGSIEAIERLRLTTVCYLPVWEGLAICRQG